jgi:glycosyltransferase 2 family protein
MKKILRCLRPLVSIASFALFVYVIQRSGPDVVLDKIRLLGWGFVVLILLSGIRHALRSVAWSHCVQTNGRRPTPLELFGPRLMGEALNELMPAGPLLGEPAKVVAISRLVSAQAGASSVIIENLVYTLAALIFMLSGLVLALFKLGTSNGIRWIGEELVICFLALIAFGYWLISRRILLLGRTLDYLKRLRVRWALVERYQHHLRAVEQATYHFFLTHKGIFLAVLGIEMATNFTGVFEAYLILKVTATHPSFFAAFLVESASRAVQLAFSFVPFGLGIQEGTIAATLQALGYAACEGVSLALIRKLRTVFWVAMGMLVAAKYSIVRPVAEESATLL